MPRASTLRPQIRDFISFFSIRISIRALAASSLLMSPTTEQFGPPGPRPARKRRGRLRFPPNTKGVLPIFSDQAGRWSLNGVALARNTKLKAIGKQGTNEVFEVPAGNY